MLVPNKMISINESCIYRASLLLSKLDGEISVVELYNNQKNYFSTWLTLLMFWICYLFWGR